MRPPHWRSGASRTRLPLLVCTSIRKFTFPSDPDPQVVDCPQGVFETSRYPLGRIQVVGRHAPDAPVAGQVRSSPQRSAAGMDRRTPAGLQRHHRSVQFPLLVGQIRRAQARERTCYASTLALPTPSVKLLLSQHVLRGAAAMIVWPFTLGGSAAGGGGCRDGSERVTALNRQSLARGCTGLPSRTHILYC
jgi:hypothetical protein